MVRILPVHAALGCLLVWNGADRANALPGLWAAGWPDHDVVRAEHCRL